MKLFAEYSLLVLLAVVIAALFYLRPGITEDFSNIIPMNSSVYLDSIRQMGESVQGTLTDRRADLEVALTGSLKEQRP